MKIVLFLRQRDIKINDRELNLKACNTLFNKGEITNFPPKNVCWEPIMDTCCIYEDTGIGLAGTVLVSERKLKA